MPFKDLSGGGSPVGEAIRETVSVDLRDVPDIRVVERGAIDKVLAEQSLQATKADLDPTSAVRVGKLLGASLLVVGGFQRSGTRVRMTARFVKVQTGEIVGTAKVDGPSSDLFKLQDRVSVELLKSVGAATSRIERVAERARPKVTRFKAVELYGAAVVQEDDHEKAEFLKLALAEDPGFSYAADDLNALEKRLRAYVVAAVAAQAAASRELAEKIAHERDPAKAYDQTFRLVTELTLQHRHHRALVVLRALQAIKPPPDYKYTDVTPDPGSRLGGVSASHIPTQMLLKMDDQALVEGERFLKEHPTSRYFDLVHTDVENIIREKRKIEAGAKESADAIAKLRPRKRANPCTTGKIYEDSHQYREARRDLVACLGLGNGKASDRAETTYRLAWTTYQLADFRASRRWLDELEAKYPDVYRVKGRLIANSLPIDD
jgi:TolB-like protein